MNRIKLAAVLALICGLTGLKASAQESVTIGRGWSMTVSDTALNDAEHYAKITGEEAHSGGLFT